MPWDLTTAKTRLGIAATDNTQDIAIQAALDASLSLAERYCNRQFAYGQQRAKYYHVHGQSLQLRRFPVAQVIKMDPERRHKVHHIQGIIEFHSPVVEDEITIEYVGGYAPFPPELEMALWNLFDTVQGAASSGGSTVQAGQISRVTLQGVGTVQFTTGAEGAASAGAGASALGSLVPLSVLSILDLFRLETV